LIYAKEAAVDAFARDLEPGVESQLVDLSEVPFAVLRELDDTAMRRSLLHVVEQLTYTPVRENQGNAERID
jgi:hypothetical protein